MRGVNRRGFSEQRTKTQGFLVRKLAEREGFALHNFPDGKFARARKYSAVFALVLSLKMR